MTPFEIIVIICAVLIVLLMGFIAYRVTTIWDANNFIHIEIKKVLNEIKDDMCDDRRDVCALLRIISNTLDNMHRNICADVAEKMADRAFPIKEGEPLDEAFEPNYKLLKDVKCKLNGFAAAVLDAECCTEEFVDIWAERICESVNKNVKQFKIDWDKLSKEQQDEFLKRLICPDYDSPFQPPKDVQGVTATGICQECNEKHLCKHYDVNRTRCFVADTETTINDK